MKENYQEKQIKQTKALRKIKDDNELKTHKLDKMRENLSKI